MPALEPDEGLSCRYPSPDNQRRSSPQSWESKVSVPLLPAPSLLVLTVLVIATGRNATQLILVMCSFCGGSLVFAQACLELVLFLLTDQFLPMTPLSDTPECCLLPSPAVVTSAPRRVWV